MKKPLKVLFSLITAALLVTAGFFFVSNLLKRSGAQKEDYAASIRTKRKSLATLEGERADVFLRLKNTGSTTWNKQSPNPCFVSFHLLDESGKVIQFDNRRFPFPHEVRPSQKIKMKASVRSPLDAGDYILEFDLLREGISWFKDSGSPTCRIRWKVEKRDWIEDHFPWTFEEGPFTKFQSSVADFNTLGKLIRLTLENNRNEFSGRTGKISCFVPGANYPQVWLRDANTILPVSLFFYETPYLSSWLEEHLAYQSEDGSLQDWVDSSGEWGKNTTETDQETSAVQAAYRNFTLLGTEWIKKKVEETKIIDRLEKALLSVLENRFDDNHGLVKGAHTADWGDVDMLDPGEEAVDVDGRTRWTADIYDQSMFYLACLQLAEMCAADGQDQKSAFWKAQADSIQKNTDKWLWNQKKGFYRIHRHLEAWNHNFDEEDILAMGGNVMAILSGMPDAEKAASIIKELLERQQVFQVSTVSGTLLPPYPENTFKHPLLDTPYEYQNGGQWDWFGGRFISAMFREGFSADAREKLLEIASKNKRNRCLYEWDDRMGTGRGSEDYSGSAGSLGRALFEGYFGILWSGEGLLLQPRLGRDSGRIHAHIPASGAFVAYEYTFFPQDDRIEFSFNSSWENRGKIEILSPWPGLEKEAGKEDEPSLLVLLDKNKIPYSLLPLNSDTYIVLECDFNNHTLEIRRTAKNTTLSF